MDCVLKVRGKVRSQLGIIRRINLRKSIDWVCRPVVDFSYFFVVAIQALPLPPSLIKSLHNNLGMGQNGVNTLPPQWVASATDYQLVCIIDHVKYLSIHFTGVLPSKHHGYKLVLQCKGEGALLHWTWTVKKKVIKSPRNTNSNKILG